MATAEFGHMSPALQEYFKSESAAAAHKRSAIHELEEGADLDLGDLDITTAQISLAGVEDQLEHFANHDVLKAILDQGCDPKEYGQQYETKLRQAELESIQDYITESDNLVELHEQVLPSRACNSSCMLQTSAVNDVQCSIVRITKQCCICTHIYPSVQTMLNTWSTICSVRVLSCTRCL